MNKRYVIVFFLSLFFLTVVKGSQLSDAEEGYICTGDFMKMVCVYRIDSPQTALQVAECVKRNSPFFDHLKSFSIEQHSRGFSEPFLKKVINYVSLFQKGLTTEQIIASEKSDHFINSHELGNEAYNILIRAFQGLTNPDAQEKLSDPWDEDSPYQAPSIVSQKNSHQPQESRVLLPTEQYFENNSFTDYLIFLSFKNPPPSSPGSGHPDSTISFPNSESFLRSFTAMAEFYYGESLKVSAKQLDLPQEEKELPLSTSLLKPLLETPLTLVLSYVTSFLMLIIGSFADLRLSSTTLGPAFSRSINQVSASLSYLASFWEDWCVRKGFLPKRAFIRSF